MKRTLISYLLSLIFLSACDKQITPPVPPVIDPVDSYHFDLFMTVGKHGGMSQGDGTIVRSVDALTADQPAIDIRGTGVELAGYTLETIVRGQYYYQIPTSADRFTKFRIVDNTVQVVQEQPFVANTYKPRSYTHTWLDDDTLLIAAANGAADKILWTRLRASDMRILAEGTLDLPLPEGAAVFSASGILTYNAAADKLYYFYFGKNSSGRTGKPTSNFLVATIDPGTMAVLSNRMNTLAGETAGSAYGELLQSSVMYDESGNLYLAAFTNTETMEQGHLLRINKGDADFDPSFEGFPAADGKLLTVQYLGSNKALVYSRNDALGTTIDSFSHYYSVVDLATGTRSRLAFEGVDVPYSAGRFASRTAVVGGRAYIGVDTEAGTGFYIYKDGVTEKGAAIAPGYYFDALRVVENE